MSRGRTSLLILATAGLVTGSLTGAEAGDTFSCFGREATITGTTGPDDLRGTDGPDVIVSLGGGDTIQSRGGRDRVCSGAGQDEIGGAGGRDRLYGDRGVDRIQAGDGNDFADGGRASDVIRGGPGDDYLRGGSAAKPTGHNDGDSFPDRLYGGDDSDTCEENTGDEAHCETIVVE